MTSRPQAESIYTLQRRIGALRHLPDSEPEPETEQSAAQGGSRKDTSTLGKLFAWRIRPA